MNLKVNVWRQKNAKAQGQMVAYSLEDVSPNSSFLEMLDKLNEQLVGQSEMPVAFDHDCREGICGMCSLVVNGAPHGPQSGTTVCQLHMRQFKDGDTITVEPWRAGPFPVIRDLIVDRSAFDRIIQSGGYVSVGTGGTPDANATPISKTSADRAMDAASCIGCGACVAACPNASAMLFVAAKVSHLNRLPQGQVERDARAVNMVAKMDDEGFGGCTNHLECEASCPKDISVDCIAQLNRDYSRGMLLPSE